MTDKLQHGYDALTLNQNKQYKEPTTTATTGKQLLSYLLWDAAIIETSLCENSKHLHVWAVIASLFSGPFKHPVSLNNLESSPVPQL